LNVYDFDHTIYDGDSTKDFYLYCLRHRWSLVRYWPRQALAVLKYYWEFTDKTRFKESVYVFFQGLPDMDNFVYDFWRTHIHKIKHFYQVWQRPDDLIISASPDFLLEEACRRLGVVNHIASRVDPATGRYRGLNCFGDEKVCRFQEEYPEAAIESFYSDSSADAPLAALAQKSYLVRGEQVFPWGTELSSAEPKWQRWAITFLSRQFAVFFLVGLINTVNGILFSMLYSMLLSVSSAFIAGYATSLTVSYLLNSRYVFRESLSPGKYLRFCLSYIPNFLIQNIVVFIVYYLAGLHRFLAFVLAAAVGMPVTFLILKLLAFREGSG